MKFKAYFINELDHTFTKTFDSGEELERFILSAAEVGTKLISFISIERGNENEKTI